MRLDITIKTYLVINFCQNNKKAYQKTRNELEYTYIHMFFTRWPTSIMSIHRWFTLTKIKNKIRQLLKYYLHTTDYKFQTKLSNA